MGKIMKSTVERAAGEVRKQRARLAQLREDLAAAQSELAAVQRRAPEEFLDDETGTVAAKAARAMGELRDRIDIIGRTIPAQEQRVTAAERAYLDAEAEQLEQPLAAARAALTRHEAKTAALLHELEEHECRYVPESEYLIEVWQASRPAMANGGDGSTGIGPSFTVESPKSGALIAAVAKAERPVQILRDLAEGREPVLKPGEDPAEVYPACVWGPDALVPVAAYARVVAAQRRNLDTVNRRAAELEERLAKARARNEKTRGGPLIATRGLEEQLARIPQERANAEARLQQVTGSTHDAGDAAAAS